MPKFLISLLTELVSVIGGGLAGSLSLVVNIMQKGFGAAVQFHQEGIALARDLGLSASQAQAYTKALTESTVELANKYGVTADAIKAVQRGISESTGRQLLLNDAQREQLVIADKLVGAQTRNQFTAEIMNHLGGQVSTVEGAISKAYATAAKQGLNAQKFSATVAKNLSLANKLSFRDGINGIIRMTALSEKLGFNLQSVESAANKFMELDSAIESSAQLQMLGGAAGAYGSNPLTMAYEANYDPEAFTERMTKMLGGYAQFDTKTGMANVNGMNRDFVKSIAQAMGISMDEAMTIAKKNAEVKFKENQFSTQLTNRFGSDEATKNYILNNSTYNTETKQLELNGRNINEYTDEEIAELKRMSSMSDHDLMVEQAKALTSLPEQINGAASAVAASFAKGIEEYIPGFREQVREIGNFLSGHAKNWGQSVGQILSTVLTFLKEKGPKILDTTEKIFNGIDKLIEAVGPIVKWITENPWKSLFMYISGKAALKALIKNPRNVGNAANGIGRIGSKIVKFGGGILSSAISVGMAGLDVKSIKEQLNELDKKYKNGKISKEEYYSKSRELTIQKNEAIGSGAGAAAFAALGSIIGPEGTFIGGIIGNFLGGLAGKIWNSVSTTVSDFWNGTVRDIAEKAFGKLGTDFVDYVSIMTDSITSGYGVILERTLNGIGTLLGGYWDGIKISFNGWLDGLTKIFKGDFVEGAKTIIKAQGESSWKMIESTVSGVWQTFTAPFFGLAELLKGGWKVITKGWDNAMSSLSNLWGRFREGLLNQISPENKEKIKEAIENIKEKWDTLSNTVSELWNSTINGFKTAWDEKVAQPSAALWEGIKNAWNEHVSKPWNDFNNWIKEKFKPIFDWFEGIWNVAKKLGDKISKFSTGDLAESAGGIVGELINLGINKLRGHASGGIVGGDSFSGDKVITRVNSGEMILNASQQSSLFSFISNIPSIMSSMLNNRNDVKAKPVGEREYIYTPSNSNASNGVTEVTVRDINVNVNGTLKLDTRGFIKDLDVSQLLNDTSFVSQLKELIKQSINNDINGGRFMNDNAVMRGMPAQTTLWGRK